MRITLIVNHALLTAFPSSDAPFEIPTFAPERAIRVDTSPEAMAELMVAEGFVRIVTHSHFPNGPTPLPQALAVIDAMMGQANGHRA